MEPPQNVRVRPLGNQGVMSGGQREIVNPISPRPDCAMSVAQNHVLLGNVTLSNSDPQDQGLARSSQRRFFGQAGGGALCPYRQMARGSEGNAQILRQPRYAKCEVSMRSPPATYPAIHGTQRFKRQPKIASPVLPPHPRFSSLAYIAKSAMYAPPPSSQPS